VKKRRTGTDKPRSLAKKKVSEWLERVKMHCEPLSRRLLPRHSAVPLTQARKHCHALRDPWPQLCSFQDTAREETVSGKRSGQYGEGNGKKTCFLHSKTKKLVGFLHQTPQFSNEKSNSQGTRDLPGSPQLMRGN
jgi:hypothetical protein